MARAKLEYRPIRPEDMDSFEELMTHREMPQTAHERRILVEYGAFSNPMAKPDQPTYVVVVGEDQRVMGYFGTMPQTYIIQGELVDTATPHDLFVHPELRAAGMAFFICAKLYKMVEALATRVFPVIWVSQENRELQKTRKHYKDSGGGRRMARVMRTKSQLHRFREKVPAIAEGPLGHALAFAADQALGVFDKGARAVLGRGLTVNKVTRFDRRFDAFAKRVIPRAAMQPYKPAKLLNWKYIDRPFNRKTCYAVEKDGEVMGWVVVGQRMINNQPTGAIIDFMAMPDDDDVISALIAAAISHFHRTDVVLVEGLATDPRFARVFKRFLFTETSTTEYMLIGGVGKYDGPPEAFVCNPDNWHLTYGDTDGFLFTW